MSAIVRGFREKGAGLRDEAQGIARVVKLFWLIDTRLCIFQKS